MADYDIGLQYYPDKVNVLPNSLSRKPETNRISTTSYSIKGVTQGDDVIGLDGDSEDQCVRIVDGISDPTDIDGRNQNST